MNVLGFDGCLLPCTCASCMQVDIKLRIQRAGDLASFSPGAVMAWLKPPPLPSFTMRAMQQPQRSLSRGLAVVAGPCTGKSTISVVLVSHPLTRGHIHAQHFFKYDDVRRQDLVRVIKSLAFQLATR